VERTESGELEIWEHHSPIMDVLAEFPIVAKLETEMFHTLLGVPVEREEDRVAGLFRARFRLGKA
jgi:predicted ArsR family transcriptional regulator